MYSRLLNLRSLSARRSVFLFGPRSTGKSTLIRHEFPEARTYDLLAAETYGRLLRNPGLLAEETSPESLTVIDEIQKLPGILDEVHRLIANRNQRFILTGSSARKIKRGAANLLAGRARWANLFPLTSAELPHFDLGVYLTTGGLPQIYGDHEAALDLRSYVDLYLKEEIQAEALARKVASFAAVLDCLALCNGEEINATSIGSDAGISGRTVLNYIEILEDTLLAFQLPVFQKTKKRKPTSRKKLYFFDVGVTNALCKRGPILMGSELFGKVFEHFLILEVRAAQEYLGHHQDLSFWRTSSGFEVDLIIGDHTAIEIKSTQQTSAKHLRGLQALDEDVPFKSRIVVSLDPEVRKSSDGIEILPWKVFLDRLWAGAYRS